MAFGGPFNPLPVPFYYFSPLLTTSAQALAAARTILARRQRAAGRTLTFEAIPHPGLEAGDLVTVTSTNLVAAAAVVESLTMPLTPDGGAMTGTLRVIG
jgi:hypothetical protein